TPGLLDDPVDRRQPEAGPLAHFLGGEERLEEVRPHLVGHAAARVGDREKHLGRGTTRPRTTAVLLRRSCSGGGGVCGCGRLAGGCLVPAARRFEVVIVKRPPLGMASRALTTRFMSTCSNWPGSALIGQGEGSSVVTSSMSSPISRRSSLLVSVTRVLRSRRR